VCRLATSGVTRGSHIHLINAYTVALADQDPHYAEVLSGDSINFPDGKPLSWVSRARRDTQPLSQVRGHQLFQDVFDAGRDFGLKHFLLGSTDDVLAKMTEKLNAKFPGAEIVGSYSPPYRPLTEDEVEAQDRAIAKTGANVVWVGLGTPKQDLEARRLARSLPVVAVAIGAAFDFAAGTVKEAPEVLTKLGLEWTYRFAMEPRRLWRRYVFGNVRFLRAAARKMEPSGRRPLSSKPAEE
jgi:N-acetylglucosaminyldiphosphoundecaprenol N-acetyl-beta-D-mannosaminyltransferase